MRLENVPVTHLPRYKVRRDAGPIEWIFDLFGITLTFCFFTGAWYWPTDSQVSYEFEAPFINLLNYFVIMFGLLKALGSREREIIGFLKKNILLFAFVTFCFLSAAWSDYFFRTIRSSLTLLALPLIIFGFTRKYGEQGLLIALLAFFNVIVLISLLLASLDVQISLMDGDHLGKWRGLFNHKNLFGVFCAISLLLLLFTAKILHIPLLLRSILIVANLVCLYMANSSTALAALLISALFAGSFTVLLKILKNKSVIWMFFVVLLIALSSLVLLNLDDVNDFLILYFGKDLTLSGRVQIWTFFNQVFSEQPLLGRGYGTPFLPDDYFAAARTSLFKSISSPHNTVLAAALNVGLIGAFLYVLWGLKILTHATLSAGQEAIGEFWLATCIFSLILSSFEVTGAMGLSRSDYLIIISCSVMSFSARLERASQLRVSEKL